LIGIPLAYFVPQFELSFLFLFSSYRLSDQVTFGIIYTIIFAATKTVGGILFAAVFWNIAKN
jgi:hypothetical protein